MSFASLNRKQICLALAVLVLVVYWPVQFYDWIDYDDPIFVSKHPRVIHGLTWDNFKWAMVTSELEYWHPLVWLSHLTMVSVFGMKAGPQHVLNVVLHAFSVVMLFMALNELTGFRWRSAVVAALFAVHPVHVESVAWITERKDVLYGAFFFAALFAYARFAHLRDQSPGRSAARWWYAISLLAFLMALASKPMAITLTGVLLLCDWWPLGRVRVLNAKRNATSPVGHSLLSLGIEKIPFLLLSLAVGLFAVYAQHDVGTLTDLGLIPLPVRFIAAVMSYVRYVAHVVWPMQLSIYYPWTIPPPIVYVPLAILLAAVTGFCIWQIRRRPYLLFGWLWYLGTMLPTSGVMQSGSQAMADRYLYVPAAGLYFIVVWAMAPLMAHTVPRQQRRVAAMGSVVVYALLIFMARVQMAYWQDDCTLFARAEEVTEKNHLSALVLGNCAHRKGDDIGAAGWYTESIMRNPGSPFAYLALGNLLLDGDPKRAEALYRAYLLIRPKEPTALGNRAIALARLKRGEEAVAECDKVQQLVGDSAQLRLIRAEVAEQGFGDTASAIAHLKEALRLDPTCTPATENIARLQSPTTAPAKTPGA